LWLRQLEPGRRPPTIAKLADYYESTFFERHGMDVTFAGKTGTAADVIGVR
jgi:hypothetical protein